MGEIKGFLKYERKDIGHRPVEDRVRDYKEMDLPLTPEDIKQQAARCISCGVPFCCGSGCPLGNLIPEFNELVYKGRWKQACDYLHSTNNFPEITGRICPAPCETSCTLSINDSPVNIRHIEYQIVERGFQEGWIKPLIPKNKTGKKVAVVGSGPAGLAAAQQLARAGHDVVVFEKNEKPGGMLRYGIPDFKLDKKIIDRRLEQMKAEGVEFQNSVKVGEDVSSRYLLKRFDCLCLAMGAEEPRDLAVQGRGYENIMFAWDFLAQQNRLVGSESIEQKIVTANGKNVAVIGGGDTGSDCVGTSRRHGAKNIYQLEILPKPPDDRPDDTPWPMWPRIMRTSTSHQEGCERYWSVMTKKLTGIETKVTELHACQVEWVKKDNKWSVKEIPNTEFVLKVDLVLLAMGFVHVVHAGLINDLQLKLDPAGNIIVDNYQTSCPRVFAVGDSVSGASLVVKAVKSARDAAAAIDTFLRNGG